MFSPGGLLVFTGRQYLFKLNFCIKKEETNKQAKTLSYRWSNQEGKVIVTAGQFSWCLALYEPLYGRYIVKQLGRSLLDNPKQVYNRISIKAYIRISINELNLFSLQISSLPMFL